MSAFEQMKRFIEPESVALFGVSRHSGEGTYNILEHLLGYGYKGKIYVVNPNATEILGMKAYASIADVHEPIDLAVINLPRSLVPGIVRECRDAGVRAVIIATQGFADATDEEGKNLQRQIDDIVRNDGVRILGPNSLGIANAFINFSSSYARLNMTRVQIGIVCQTGAFMTFLNMNMIGKAIDIANACDVGFLESLEYFEEDPQVRVVVLHIEGMMNSRRFLETASRITRKKPVLALKTGRSETAARAARSHTGSLTGSDLIWDAAFNQSGIIRFDSTDEMGDVARYFAVSPLMKGRKIGIITISGGIGVLALDSCSQNDLEIARLSPATLERVRSLSPAWQGIDNPLDIWPAYIVMKNPLNKVVGESLNALIDDPGVDAILFIWAVNNPQIYTRVCHVLVEQFQLHRGKKPMACCMMGGYMAEAKKTLEDTGGTVVFPTPEKAAKALGYLARYSAFRGVF